MMRHFPGPPGMKDEIRESNWPKQYISGTFRCTWKLWNDNIVTILNKIYETGQNPPDISKSIFIALPKKTGGNIV